MYDILIDREKKRREWLNTYLKKWITAEGIKNVLDYGGDRGQIIPEIFKNSNKYVYEISGNESEPGVTILKTIEEVAAVSWDFIMCCQLLEHVSNPIGIIKCLVKNLKENSFLYLELPVEDRVKYYSNVEIHEHINFYSEETMRAVGRIFGLVVIDVRNEERLIRALFRKCN